MHFLQIPIQNLLGLGIARFCLSFIFIASCEGVLHSHLFEYSTSQGGPLLFEDELCPELQYRVDGEGWRDRPILLQHDYDHEGKSPCVFNVTTMFNNLKIQEVHPTRARLLGMFITENKGIPWPANSGNRIWNEFCSNPLHIDLMGLVQRRSEKEMIFAQPNPLEHIPKPLCRVTNEIFMVRRRIRHLQSKIWFQVSSGLLALSVDKELDFTSKINKIAGKGTKVPIMAPRFAHLMFLFNSTGQKCFIRVEHYSIGNRSKAICDDIDSKSSCDIYPCADELRLQLVTTDLWLKRGIRRHLNHFYKTRSDNEEKVKDDDPDPGHPSLRVLLCAWTPVLLCLYLLCRRGQWTEDPETEEVSETPGSQNRGIVNSPPTYSEVLEMDSHQSPPTYSDVCNNYPASTTIAKIFKLEKKPSLPTPTNV